jgi:hypothetical protein
MQPGSEIEVRCRFDDRWVGGFVVAEVDLHEGAEQVWVTRRSDGNRLPVPFAAADVRTSLVTGAALRG